MKKLMVITAALLAMCLLIPVACGASPPGATSEGTASTGVSIDREESYKDTNILISDEEERMIVRSGDMSLIVEDVVNSRDEIDRIALLFNGYVVSSQIWGEEEDMRGQISIRVPDEKFNQTLAELRELAVRVDSEITNSQDVTEEYVDLESRLRNAEATESQYLALLEKAVYVEDILKIYDSLSRVRSEIEQIKGRMQYLERTSSMSLISVNLQPVATAKPLVRVGWNALEVLKAAVRGIVTFGQWLGTIVLWLIIFIPVWGIPLGIILWRRRKKKSAKGKGDS
ncbi:DUF4349 domain-containing protein [Chloroflexota bacterium]